jgi:hypothetical protein
MYSNVNGSTTENFNELTEIKDDPLELAPNFDIGKPPHWAYVTPVLTISHIFH